MVYCEDRLLYVLCSILVKVVLVVVVVWSSPATGAARTWSGTESLGSIYSLDFT